MNSDEEVEEEGVDFVGTRIISSTEPPKSPRTNRPPSVSLKNQDSFRSVQSGTSESSVDQGNPSSEIQVAHVERFDSLDELIKYPAWCSVFLHFLLVRKNPNHMLLYLHIKWFLKAPDADDATTIYQLFLSNGAGLSPTCISDFQGFVRDLETELDNFPRNLVRLRTLFLQIMPEVEANVSGVLGDLRTYFTKKEHSEDAVATGAHLLVKVDSSGDNHMDQSQIVARLLMPFAARINSDNVLLPVDQKIEVMNKQRSLKMALATVMGKFGVSETKLKILRAERSATKKKVHFHQGHRFVVATYTHPTWCGHCKGLLWGVRKQGWQCLDCGFNVHKSGDITGKDRCHKELTQPCRHFKVGEIRGMEKKTLKKGKSISRGPSIVSPSRTRTWDARDMQKALATEGVEFEDASDDETEDLASIPTELPQDPGEEPDSFSEYVSSDSKSAMKKMHGKSKEMKRQELIYELIQTEKSYFRFLVIIRKLFKEPLQQAVFQEPLQQTEYKVPPSEISTLFGNIESLIIAHVPLHNALLNVQKKHNGSPITHFDEEVINAFKNLPERSYQAFCINQSAAVDLLKLKRAQDPLFEQTVSEYEKNSACKRQALKDLLALPFQRLSKYPLLFKGISEALSTYDTKEKKDDKLARLTDEEKESELKNLADLQKKAEEMLTSVNSALRDAQDRAKLEQIDANLDRSGFTEAENTYIQELCTTSRKLIMEGSVVLKIDKKTKKIYLVLLSDALLILEQEDGKYTPIKRDEKVPMMVLGTVLGKENAKNKKSFFVINTAKYNLDGTISDATLCEFEAPTKKSCKAWLEKINEQAKSFKAFFPHWVQDLEKMAKLRRSTTMESGGGSATLMSPTASSEYLNVPGTPVLRRQTTTPVDSPIFAKSKTLPVRAHSESSFDVNKRSESASSLQRLISNKESLATLEQEHEELIAQIRKKQTDEERVKYLEQEIARSKSYLASCSSDSEHEISRSKSYLASCGDSNVDDSNAIVRSESLMRLYGEDAPSILVDTADDLQKSPNKEDSEITVIDLEVNRESSIEKPDVAVIKERENENGMVSLFSPSINPTVSTPNNPNALDSNETEGTADTTDTHADVLDSVIEERNSAQAEVTRLNRLLDEKGDELLFIIDARELMIQKNADLQNEVLALKTEMEKMNKTLEEMKKSGSDEQEASVERKGIRNSEARRTIREHPTRQPQPVPRPRSQSVKSLEQDISANDSGC